MEIGSIFLLFGIGILALAFLLRPFFLEQLKLVTPSKRAAAYPEDAECITLREEQDRLIQSVHDLDFDHKLGKVADDIYRDQRKELVAQGSAILKRISSMPTKYGFSFSAAMMFRICSNLHVSVHL